MRPKWANVGLVNSKKAAVHGITGKARVITKSHRRDEHNERCGQPAFSIGNIDRIDAISRSSVDHTGDEPVGLQNLRRDAIKEPKIDEIKDGN